MKEYIVMLKHDIERAKHDYDRAIDEMKDLLNHSDLERSYNSCEFTRIAARIDDAKARYYSLVRTKGFYLMINTMCKTCETCKYFIRDLSTNSYDCNRCDELTDNDVKCFEDNTPGCTCYEEDTTDYQAEDEYYESIGGFYCGI